MGGGRASRERGSQSPAEDEVCGLGQFLLYIYIFLLSILLLFARPAHPRTRPCPRPFCAAGVATPASTARTDLYRCEEKEERRRERRRAPMVSLLITSSPSPQDDAAADDGWAHEARAGPPSDPVPYREVLLAIGLLLAGCGFAALARASALGKLDGHVHPGATGGFATLAALTFLPGFYTTRLAFYAARGRPGYSFADIPRGQT